MEWPPAWLTYIMLVAVIYLLQTATRWTDAASMDRREIKNYSIPGEQCDSGYIIDTWDQYAVHSANQQSKNGTEIAKYRSDTDCTLKFRANEGERFLIRIVKFKLELSDKCTRDGLYLYDGLDTDARILTKTGYALCGLTLSLPNYFTTNSSGVTIKFKSDTSSEHDGFQMYITPFTDDESCDDGFKCATHKKCITKYAVCNGAHQCEDGSDEPDGCTSAGVSDVRIQYPLFTLTFLVMLSLR